MALSTSRNERVAARTCLQRVVTVALGEGHGHQRRGQRGSGETDRHAGPAVHDVRP